MTSSHKKPFIQGLAGSDLTSMQRTFVMTLVRHGCTPTQAAREAGYSDPKVAAYDLLRSAHIQTAVRFERSRYVMSDLANIATGTLRDVMEDKEAPASARVQAARTVLELAGELGRGKTDPDVDRPLSELTADELTRMIDRWTQEKAALAKPIDQHDQALATAVGMAQLAH
jgi:hypothetical protein